MKEVLINCCFGGFSFSFEALQEYYKRKGIETYLYRKVGGDYETGRIYQKVETIEDSYIFYDLLKKDMGAIFNDKDIPVGEHNNYIADTHDRELRWDETMIQVVKDLGNEKASGECADLYITEYDETCNNPWIDEYDGSETLINSFFATEAKIKELGGSEELIQYLKQCRLSIK